MPTNWWDLAYHFAAQTVGLNRCATRALRRTYKRNSQDVDASYVSCKHGTLADYAFDPSAGEGGIVEGSEVGGDKNHPPFNPMCVFTSTEGKARKVVDGLLP